MKKYVMPVGKSDFEKIRKENNYYVDKTNLISQILSEGAEVTLFTRPRRFGKSLNMSMLENFFDIRKDSKAIFEGLEISENEELCEKWMNQYPTILISFKDIGGADFEKAISRLKNVLYKLYDNHSYLIKDNRCAGEYEIEKFNKFLSESNSNKDLTDALVLLSKLMYDYYQKPVIVLIDEYDVPMAKGDANGYYREITDIIRYMLSKVLKDNPYLKLAVMTGCLRIAKESIFTGLNNLRMNSIMDFGYDEYFGFTDAEINQLLADTELTAYKGKIRQWYDGYHFGDSDVYCPWDVLNYISDLQQKPGLSPKNYWTNTSSNEIIRKYLDTGINPNADFEALLRGECIKKTIYEDITYENLVSSEENFWSVLYMTGYLTTEPKEFVSTLDMDDDFIEDDQVSLKLVNNEIKSLFARTIARWFKETIVKDNRTALFEALWKGDDTTLSETISRYLRKTISYYDYNENFYHAFLAGLLSGVNGYNVESNREAGEGRADLMIRNEDTMQAAVLELKVVKSLSDVQEMCDKALEQIDEKGYVQTLMEEEGYDVLKYGVVFFKKRCFIKKR
ncbi:MAG: AAA family ATPase [Clostridia bacterium]|nr:AAA family ATPase [Clostridia bacterium]